MTIPKVDGTGWTFHVEAVTGAMRFAIGNGEGFPEVIGTVDVLDGSFHHVAGTWDGTTMHLYVDGSPSEVLWTNSMFAGANPVTVMLTIGNNAGSTSVNAFFQTGD